MTKNDVENEREHDVNADSQLKSSSNHSEEYAAEWAESTPKVNRADAVSDREVETLVDDVSRNKAVGYIALFVALAALFVWPVILGVSGVILGVIAFYMGNKALGSWSMALGFIAVAAYFLLAPYSA